MFIDLSHELSNETPIFPGDSETSIKQTKSFKHDGYNAFRFSCSLHTGTHIDFPSHFSDSAFGINNIPVDYFCKEAILLDVRGQNQITMRPEYENIIQKDSVVIIHSGHSKYYGSDEYFNKQPVITEVLCDFLIGVKTRIVGFDMPSPDMAPFIVHKKMSAANIYILENLTNLDKLIDKKFKLYAFPIKIEAEAAFVRAVAEIIS